MSKLPSWFKQEIPDTATLDRAQRLSQSGVRTVCQEALCPNLSFCLRRRSFTFLILGNTCTRNCRFCAVGKSANKTLCLDRGEPARVAKAVKDFGLDYVVITSVTRDDLADGGAEIFARTIESLRQISANIKVEVLIPDFAGRILSLKVVLDARPHLVGHNIETVKRLYKDLRPEADYQLSLDILKKIKEIQPLIATKSSIMLGLGEGEEEVITAMQDLLNSGCDILTLGQYLPPSKSHYPVKEFINIEQFEYYRVIGLGLGFKSVLAGPLIRSSYGAQELYESTIISN
ncbi:MAG: lipoyl synthase [Candidatus Omnitrophica bacterium]|nr:lipoyl synthase [Candidatus Omnitrophota bacterium]